MATDKIKIELKNDLSELDRLCLKLTDFGKTFNLPKKSVFQICLVMEEICSNIISYGYKDKNVHWIQVMIQLKNKMLEFQIEDDGIPFNPVETEKPDLTCPLDQREEGGLGCHLVKNIMDHVIYKRVNNKNILTVKKILVNSDLEKAP